MSFVESFGIGEPDDDAGTPEERVRPPWHGPPEDELGIAVPQGLVIARSERGVVALSFTVAYSTGVSFQFVAQARGLSHSAAQRLFHEQHMFDDELPDGLLRLGLELPGGARVSNLGGRRARRAFMGQEEPDGPVLVPHAGGGGMSSSDRVSMLPAYWLWPLPQPGTLSVSCEWPTVEIPLTMIEIDTGPVVAAAAESTPLWPSSPAG
jgi:hypothetical protein